MDFVRVLAVVSCIACFDLKYLHADDCHYSPEAVHAELLQKGRDLIRVARRGILKLKAIAPSKSSIILGRAVRVQLRKQRYALEDMAGEPLCPCANGFLEAGLATHSDPLFRISGQIRRIAEELNRRRPGAGRRLLEAESKHRPFEHATRFCAGASSDP